MSLIATSNAPTMSSREISDLTGKRHDNVKRVIEALAEQGVIGFPQIEEIPTATKPVSVFVFTGEQGKRDSIIVVAQLSPEFTARLVDRWRELEALMPNSHNALPNFSNPVEAARAWADQVEESQKLALENKAKDDALAAAAPKVAGFDRIAGAEGSITIREAANTLRVPERKFVQWLIMNDWCYRRAGHKSLLAYADKVKAGYLFLKQTPIRDIHTDEERLSEQVRITPLGLTALDRRLSKDGRQIDMPVGAIGLPKGKEIFSKRN